MARLRLNDGRALILVGGALLTGAMQFGIISGQLSMPAISLCFIAFWLAEKGDRPLLPERPEGCCAQKGPVPFFRLAGILLGLACVIKPQVAGPFVLYYLMLRRFKLATWAIVVGGGITAVSLAAMRISHIDWWHGWQHSVNLTMAVGDVNDYGWAGKFRDEIVDLKILIVSMIHNPVAQRIVVWAIVALLLGWYVRSFPRGEKRRDSRTELLALAVLSAIELLPVYHRVYDVSLLALALAWALAALDGPPRRRKFAVAALIPMCVFLIPFGAVRTFGRRLPAIVAMSQSGWWQSTVTLHYAWALLALTIILLAALRREAAASDEDLGDLSADAISSPSPRAGRPEDQPR